MSSILLRGRGSRTFALVPRLGTIGAALTPGSQFGRRYREEVTGPTIARVAYIEFFALVIFGQSPSKRERLEVNRTFRDTKPTKRRAYVGGHRRGSAHVEGLPLYPAHNTPKQCLVDVTGCARPAFVGSAKHVDDFKPRVIAGGDAFQLFARNLLAPIAIEEKDRTIFLQVSHVPQHAEIRRDAHTGGNEDDVRLIGVQRVRKRASGSRDGFPSGRYRPQEQARG